MSNPPVTVENPFFPPDISTSLAVFQLLFHFCSIFLSITFVGIHSKKLWQAKTGDIAASRKHLHFLIQLTLVSLLALFADISMITEYSVRYSQEYGQDIYRLFRVCTILKVSLGNLACGLYVFVGLQRMNLFETQLPRLFKKLPSSFQAVTALVVTLRTFLTLYLRSVKYFGQLDAAATKSNDAGDTAMSLIFWGWIGLMVAYVDGGIVYFVLKSRRKLLKHQSRSKMVEAWSLKGIILIIMANAFIMVAALILGGTFERHRIYGFNEFLIRLYFAGGLYCLHKVKELSAQSWQLAGTAAGPGTSMQYKVSGGLRASNSQLNIAAGTGSIIGQLPRDRSPSASTANIERSRSRSDINAMSSVLTEPSRTRQSSKTPVETMFR